MSVQVFSRFVKPVPAHYEARGFEDSWNDVISAGITTGRCSLDYITKQPGFPESGVDWAFTREGHASAHSQLANATGERIDVGLLPACAEYTAFCRYIPHAGSGEAYGQVMCLGDGVFGTDTRLSFGWRNGSDIWFLYGRNAGSLLGAEANGVVTKDVIHTAIARVKAGTWQLWVQQGPDAVLTQMVSATSGIGSGIPRLWLGGAGNMAASASQSSPAADILAYGVWPRFISDSERDNLVRNPYARFRPRRARRYFVVGGAVGEEHEASRTEGVILGESSSAVLYPRHEAARTEGVVLGFTAAATLFPRHEGARTEGVVLGESSVGHLLQAFEAARTEGVVLGATHAAVRIVPAPTDEMDSHTPRIAILG